MEPIIIEHYVENLDPDEVVTLEVEYHWEGEDRAETLTDPAEYAEVEIDGITHNGYMVDEYLTDDEFEELESKVDHIARFGDE